MVRKPCAVEQKGGLIHSFIQLQRQSLELGTEPLAWVGWDLNLVESQRGKAILMTLDQRRYTEDAEPQTMSIKEGFPEQVAARLRSERLAGVGIGIVCPKKAWPARGLEEPDIRLHLGFGDLAQW